MVKCSFIYRIIPEDKEIISHHFYYILCRFTTFSCISVRSGASFICAVMSLSLDFSRFLIKTQSFSLLLQLRSLQFNRSSSCLLFLCVSCRASWWLHPRPSSRRSTNPRWSSANRVQTPSPNSPTRSWRSTAGRWSRNIKEVKVNGYKSAAPNTH